MGVIAIGAWHTYTVKAVWSHDPSQGRLEFYVDGKLKGKVTGRDVNLGPKSNRLPEMKLGLYGDYAVGVIDVDNVKANPSSGGNGGSSPAPSVSISAPARRLRVVEASRLRQPGGTGDDWRLHLAYDFTAGRMGQVLVTAQHTGEHRAHDTLRAGDVVVADHG